MTSFEPSSRSTIRNHSSSFTKVLDQTSGMQTSSAKYEAPSKPLIDISFARGSEKVWLSSITVRDP